MNKLPSNSEIRRSVTLKDVAREAGMSVSAVSRALNRPGRITEKTAERALEAARRLGYRPNTMARALKAGATKSIYVLMPRMSAFFIDMFSGIERAAAELGYSVFIRHTGRDPAREWQYFEDVVCSRADGILLLSTGTLDLAENTVAQLPPAVAVLEQVEGYDIPSVRIDHAAVAQAVIEYLAGLGHRHIAHIAGDPKVAMARQRLDGFLAASRNSPHGMTADWVATACNTESGEIAMKTLLGRMRRPTAVFCSCDEQAAGAMMAIQGAGLRVPEDISIVGLNDQPPSRLFQGITTVHVPAEEMGYRAMHNLGCIIANLPYERDVVLPTRIIPRGSTGFLAARLQALAQGKSK